MLTLTELRAEDVPQLARIHCAAFPDFFLSTLGEPFLRQFYQGYLNDPTAVAVVLRDPTGRPMGASVGCTEPEAFFRSLIRRQWFGFGLAAVRAALRHPRVAARLARGALYRGKVEQVPTPPGALCSSICTDPGIQGQGAGRLLMFGWEEEARRLGATQAHLTTDAESNKRINEWYQRAGWGRTASYTTREGRKMNVYWKDLTT